LFRFRYNFLALTQVILGLVNYVFFIKIFGVSAFSDAYLLIGMIFAALHLIQLQFIEQFLVFYNDEKLKSKKNACEFYQFAIFVALCLGGFSYMICFIGVDYILSLFTHNIDDNRLYLLHYLFGITAFELIVLPIFVLNQKLMNAEQFFSAPYILMIVPQCFLLMATGLIFVNNMQAVDVLLYAKASGTLVATLVSLYIVTQLKISFSPKLYHPAGMRFLRNSFSMRIGHNIHNFLFTPITTNILSNLPLGFASYFFYAYKMVNIINSIVVGPSLTVLYAKVSEAWSRENFLMCKKYMWKYSKVSVPLFGVASGVLYFLIPYVFPIINAELSAEAMLSIQQLFLGLAIWQLLIVIESGSVALHVTNKNSALFIVSNSLFIIVYSVVSYLLIDAHGLLALPIALVCSQAISLLIYFHFGSKLMKQKSGEL